MSGFLLPSWCFCPDCDNKGSLAVSTSTKTATHESKKKKKERTRTQQAETGCEEIVVRKRLMRGMELEDIRDFYAWDALTLKSGTARVGRET